VNALLPESITVTEQGAGRPDFVELFAALPVAALVLDGEGRVVHANAVAETLLNQSERAMFGQPLDMVLRRPVETDPPAGHNIASFDAEVETARGGRVRVDYLETMIADHFGWRVITLHAASASRRMGRSERAGMRSAMGAAAMLGHEIKNPLSGIRGAAQLIQAGGEGMEELTTLITTEVDRIAALIDRMQDLTDTRPLKPAAENIYPLLNHARGLAVAGFARDIPIVEQYDPSLPPVMADRDALLQVVINLLKNAADAVRRTPEGRITITTAYRHGMAVAPAPGRPRRPLPIELCVIDNGPGAPPDIADMLFDPFVSGKPEGQGQGLGLALVDKLVRDIGGIVHYSREGVPESTVFRLLLPRGAS
jgi:two-component system nitrogen regulation sensor histidine kinase GlnL